MRLNRIDNLRFAALCRSIEKIQKTRTYEERLRSFKYKLLVKWADKLARKVLRGY